MLLIRFPLTGARWAVQRIIEASYIHYADTLSTKCFFIRGFKKIQLLMPSIPLLPYTPTKTQQDPRVTGEMIEKECFTRFTVHNNSDTVKDFYFVPGYYLREHRNV